MNLFAAFGAGLVFGIGLILSGMTDPGKVIGFLDVVRPLGSFARLRDGRCRAGRLVCFSIPCKTANRAFFGGAMHLPASDIDNRLVLGSLVFGIGWGLAGFCPGPALVSFASGVDKAAIFVAAMLSGMVRTTPPSGSTMSRAGRRGTSLRPAARR